MTKFNALKEQYIEKPERHTAPMSAIEPAKLPAI
jgi:hypothetical protein